MSQDIKDEFKVRFVPPETLKPYFRNTKNHSEAQLRKMVEVLDRFYFDQPIVVDKDMVIIKGHGRYMASLMTKNKRLVPIIVREDLTEEQINAARISDNRLFELGEAIPEIIKQEVADFVAEGGTGARRFFDFAPAELSAANVDLGDLAQSIAPKKPSLTELLKNHQPLPADDKPKTITMTSSHDAAAKPKSKVKAVYCPNCGALHEEAQ